MRNKDKLTADPETRSADSNPQSALGNPHSPLILIVEDSPVQSELLRRALEGAGYKVIAARDGAEGLALAKANKPAAVVSDINMPVMDGYAMCHAIRGDADVKFTPVILLTMLSDPVDVIRGVNAGADAYLTKPYNIPSLISRIELLLDYPPAPPPPVERRKVEVRLEGETYLVDAHGPRILNLLISTYENAVLQNRELAATQHALEDLNEHLEQKVTEKTAALRASEMRFRSLAEMSSDFYWETDAEHRLKARETAIAKSSMVAGFDQGAQIGNRRWEIPYLSPDEAGWRAHRALLDAHLPFRNFEISRRGIDGSERHLSISGDPVFDAAGAFEGYRGVGTDITERKRSKQALALFRNLVDRSSDAIEVVEPETMNFLDANLTACEVLGYSRDELMSMRVPDIDPGMDPPAIESMKQQLLESDSMNIESLHRRKDGSSFPVEVHIKQIQLERPYYVVSVRDITERKQAQAALERSARHYRKLIEGGSDVFFLIDQSGNMLYRSPSGMQLTGWNDEEVLGKGIVDHVVAEDLPLARSALTDVIGHPDKAVHAELRLRHKDGAVRDVDITGKNLLADPDVAGIVITARDITAQKLAQRRIADSEAELKSIFEAVVDGIAVVDPQTQRLVKANGSFGTMLGYRANEIPLLSISDLHPPESLADVTIQFERQLSGEIKTAVDLPVKRKDGSVFYADISTTVATIGDKPQMVGAFHDVSERKLAEAALARVNRALRTLSTGNTALVHATDEQQLTEQMCRILVEIGGYRIAWVGYAESDEGKTVRPIAYYIQGNGYVERETVTWSDDAAGRGPSGIAIRTAKPQVVKYAVTDPAYAPWRDDAIRLGYASVASYPLLDAEQSVFGVLCIYAAESGGFTQEESDLLAEFAGDLAFGITSIRARLAHEHSVARLSRSMEGTIQAMAATLGSRDAYTAGHQRRVAELVLAIAHELNMKKDDVHAAHLAAIVHDLGKIQVPAEILSKPGKLLPVEFELIKYHPTSGYNILKDIDFPWPIAEIVYQHHERLDGSGYPRGLKGDEILPAAKILAVADTVEAMSSHRPYRAALGIDKALAEIERGRGSVYDAAAVDTCLKLFREKRFAFST